MNRDTKRLTKLSLREKTMARKRAVEETEEVLVELLIRVEGSAEINRITTFKLPLVGRTEGNDENPGQVQFESRTLVKRVVEAVRGLI